MTKCLEKKTKLIITNKNPSLIQFVKQNIMSHAIPTKKNKIKLSFMRVVQAPT